MNNIPFVGGFNVSRNVGKRREMLKNAEKFREMSSFGCNAEFSLGGKIISVYNFI